VYISTGKVLHPRLARVNWIGKNPKRAKYVYGVNIKPAKWLYNQIYKKTDDISDER